MDDTNTQLLKVLYSDVCYSDPHCTFKIDQALLKHQVKKVKANIEYLDTWNMAVMKHVLPVVEGYISKGGR